MKNTNKNNNIQSDTLSVNINNSNDFNKVLHEIKKKETQNDKRNNNSKRNLKPQIKTKKDNDTRNVTKEYEKNNIKNVRSLSNNKNNTTYLKKQNIEDDEDEKNIKFYDTPIFPYITSLILDYENDNKKPEPVSNVIESKEQIKRYNSHNKIERKNTIYDIYEKTLKKLSIQEDNVVEKNEEHLYNSSKSLEHKKSTTSEGSKIKSSVINTNISNNSFDESSSNDISVIQQKNHETKKDTKKPKQYHINDDTLGNDSNNSNYDHNNTCESINSSNEYNNNYKNKVHISENQKEKGENEKETQNVKKQQYNNNNVIKTNEKNHKVTNAFDDYYIDEEHFRQRSITIMQDKKKKKKNDRSYSLDSKSIISDELKEKNNEKEDLKKKEIKNNEKLNANKNESNQNSSHENIYYQKKTSQNENINHSLNDQTYKIKKKKSYDKQHTQKLYTRSDITTTDSDSSSINEKLNISYEIFKSKNENKMFSIDQEKKNKDSLLKVVNSKNILNIRKILRIMRELYIGFIGLQLIYFITYILFGNNNVYLIQIISMSCTLFSLLDANYHGYLLNGFIDICIAIFLNIAILQNISGFKTLQSNDVLKNITISNIVLLYFFSAFSFLNSYFIYKLHSLEKKSINYVIRNIESKTEKNIKRSVSTK
ncbi:conserved Plasmodium protein, unknown function [Plasmodium reichenowi]|uniref:Basal complex transmembrane protein 1 n=1 Tax=Plasmodium reichenowi TaxID=5854 RepID=A0A060RUY8_PLARE|nr:conserved Plasmodium protein, unknown function [Plasmodium reichenowi]